MWDDVSADPLAHGVVEGPRPHPLAHRGARVRARARGEPGQLLRGDGDRSDSRQEGEGGEEHGGEHGGERGGERGGHWRESGATRTLYPPPARPAKTFLLLECF